LQRNNPSLFLDKFVTIISGLQQCGPKLFHKKIMLYPLLVPMMRQEMHAFPIFVSKFGHCRNNFMKKMPSFLFCDEIRRNFASEKERKEFQLI